MRVKRLGLKLNDIMEHKANGILSDKATDAPVPDCTEPLV